MISQVVRRAGRQPIGSAHRAAAFRASWPVIACALIAACGGEPPAEDTGAAAESPQTANASAAVPTDACAALTIDEVAEIVGAPVRDSLALQMSDAEGRTALSQCNYATTADPAVVSLMLRAPAPGGTVERAAESVRETLEEFGTVQDVPGLSEVAFWSANQLHAFKPSGWYLIVSTSGGAGVDQARPLMERALARFP